MVCFTSCEDYLEQPPSADLTDNEVFSKFQTAEGVVTAAYTILPSGFVWGHRPWHPHSGLYGNHLSQFSDESVGMDTARLFGFMNGTVDMTTDAEAYCEFKWSYAWGAIRSAYKYYENAPRIPNLLTDEQALVKQRRAEMLGVVGVLYFEMFKRYGGMPWMNKVYASDDEPFLGRQSVEVTVDSIANLLDRAANGLPIKYEAREFGRLNKIGLKALKSRLLLYAASPLFNTNEPVVAFSNPELLCAPYSKERWKRAAEAAKEVITMAEANGYKLINTGNPTKDYTDSWSLLDATANTEALLPTRSIGDFNSSMFSCHRLYWFKTYPGAMGSASWGCTPTSNLVKLYEMKDPKAVKWNGKGYPGDGLDPRFYATILKHGDPYGKTVCDFSFNSKSPNTALGNNNVHGRRANAFATGFGLGKFGFGEMEAKGQSSVKVFWPYVRLAEIYLNYAEALNEYNSGPNEDVYKYVNMVRERAGMQPVAGLDYQKMKDLIVNERAVELAFEEHRYWDLRRWRKIDLLRAPKQGIKVLMNPDTKAIVGYDILDNPSTAMAVPDKLWYFGFPRADVLKASPDFIQNPGW
jgi:hypothetical protein